MTLGLAVAPGQFQCGAHGREILLEESVRSL